MKKTYLIIGGSLAIVLLLFIWVYLLIYGTPKPVEQFFTDFSFSGNNGNVDNIPFIPTVPNDQVDVAEGEPLRQLTTKAVVGFGEKNDASSNQRSVMYVEAGTGHVYSINMETGSEVRLSNITIVNPESAQFSIDGTMVAIRSGYGTQNTIELITLSGENSATKETLLPKMLDFQFNTAGELLYTEYNQAGLLARSLNTSTKISRTLFSVPFQNATIIWSKKATTPNFVYPKPSAKLSGYLYQITNGTLIRQEAAGNGLMAEANNTYTVHSITTAREPISYVTNRFNNTISKLPILVQPDKCVFMNLNEDTLFCGFEETNRNYEFPDNWFKGLASFSDMIWKIDLNRNLAAKLIDPKDTTGREIDMIKMNISTNDQVLYFMNKNDNTLWMYEI